jgi:beta-phosphoglucomutase-like phosphatase (HAD superfamily)
MRTAGPNLAILGVGPEVPIIVRDQVARARPDPDVFLAAAKLLRVPITSSIVVGDSFGTCSLFVALGRPQ